jgi:hypothetical protein
MDSPSTSFPCQYGQPNPYCDSPNDPPSSPSELTSLDGSYFGGGPHMPQSGAGPSPGVNMTGLPQQPRQKGRPRKRKPKDIDAMTASLGESSLFYFSSSSSNRFNKKVDLENTEVLFELLRD